MSDQENFLKRWSRRKQDAADEKAQPEPPAAADAGKATAPNKETDHTDAARPVAANQLPVPEFDLTKLPSIESIGANSDIRAFLQPGVPSELKLAALRRAWSADPAIRNYIGPAENAWDFTAPDSMPGFGDLDPNFDVKEMVAQLFGDKAANDSGKTAEPEQQVAQLTSKSGDIGDATKSAEATAPHQATGAQPAAEPENVISNIASEHENFVQREGNSALQDEDAEKSKTKVGKPRRPHGGALPH
jgi:hypothetical protein